MGWVASQVQITTNI